MTTRWKRFAKLTAACLLIGSMSIVAFIAVGPSEDSESFTEFYVLSSDGNASDYPSDLTVGETSNLTIGISNHEDEDTAYTVVIQLNKSTVGQHSMVVADGSTRQKKVTFTPRSTGTFKLRLLLFDEGDPSSSAESYRRLRIWVNVSDPPTQ